MVDWRVGAGLVVAGLFLIAIGAKIIENWLRDMERRARLIEAISY